jgi:hypothetical protein
VDTKGLVGKSAESTADITIQFYFDARMPSGKQEVDLTNVAIVEAVYTALNESAELASQVDITIEHTSYFVSISNFEEPSIKEGTFYLIRTPFGEIYYYKVSFKAGDANKPNDKITYQPFSWFECPLILFIIVVIFGYFIVTMPGRYRRVDVVKIGKLHTLATLLLVIQLLLYFFAGFGGIFIGGLYIIIISVVFVIISYMVSKTLYENAPSISKPPPKPTSALPIRDSAEPMDEVSVSDSPTGTQVQCAMCAEIYSMQAWETPSTAKCPACFNIGAEEIDVYEEDVDEDL